MGSSICIGYMAVTQEFTWADDKVHFLLKTVKIYNVNKESTIGWEPIEANIKTEEYFLILFIDLEEIPSLSDSSFHFPEKYWRTMLL